MSDARVLERPDGGIVVRHHLGDGPTPVLVLHATLSSAVQLVRLAAALTEPGDLRAILVDRRGSGESRLGPAHDGAAAPASLDVGVHVDDLVAILDVERIERILVVGHSFGGVVGLELAARHPDRVAALAVYEPPYGPFAPAELRPWFAATTEETLAAARAGGPAAAAEAFLRRVAGEGAWAALSDRARAYIAAQGGGAIADVALAGLEPDGLARIVCPVGLLVGAESEPVYAAIAAELARRIPGARPARALPGLRHPAPITDPVAVARAMREALGLDAR